MKVGGIVQWHLVDGNREGRVHFVHKKEGTAFNSKRQQ